MAYRIKRIDPFWLKSPAVPGIAVAAAAAALIAAQAGRAPLAAAAVAGLDRSQVASQKEVAPSAETGRLFTESQRCAGCHPDQ